MRGIVIAAAMSLRVVSLAAIGSLAFGRQSSSAC